MGRRTLLLVAALVVASLGTLLVFAYVRDADDRALKDQQPKRVLIAKTLIKAGTSGADAQGKGAFETRPIPASAVIEGALSEIRPVENLVAVADIFPGEQIITAKFAASGETSILPIPPGKIAMSIQMGDPERVAGFVQPGSEVVVFISGSVVVPGPDATITQNKAITTVLLPSVTVLAVGPTTLRTTATGATGNKEALPTAILSLATTQEEAQKLIFGQNNGELYFGLRNDDSRITMNRATGAANLFE